MNPTPLIAAVAVLSGAVVLFLDLRRRRLRFSHFGATQIFQIADLIPPTFLLLYVVARISAQLWVMKILDLAGVYVAAAGIALFAYLWGEGRRANQFQRPDGIVAGEFLILASLAELPLRWLEKERPIFDGWSLAGILAGGILVVAVVPRFLKRKEEHRILDRIAEHGETSQPEWTPPTEECPHPERWAMVDSMSVETEMLEFLKSLVITMKPELIVETGTFIGLSAIKMAAGLQANGFGRIITCELDPVVYAKAKEKIAASGLADWIDARNVSSLELSVPRAIDILFSDSHLPIREEEIRRFLPQLDPNGLLLMHDTSSHFKIAREVAFRLEREGLIAMVLLPTPRGLMIAQKRAGHR